MAENKFKTMLLLMAILFPISLSAFEMDGIAYEITSSTGMTVQVVSKSGGYSGEVVIPEEVTYNEKNIRWLPSKVVVFILRLVAHSIVVRI